MSLISTVKQDGNSDHQKSFQHKSRLYSPVYEYFSLHFNNHNILTFLCASKINNHTHELQALNHAASERVICRLPGNLLLFNFVVTSRANLRECSTRRPIRSLKMPASFRYSDTSPVHSYGGCPNH